VATGRPVALVPVLGLLGQIPLAQSAVVSGVAAVTTLLLRSWFRKRAGGVAGDFLGAAEQSAEVSMLLAWLVLKRAGV
jgi:cobalamin synthase